MPLSRTDPPPFDAIVGGGGVQGLAALWQLARRGARVALVEQFAALADEHRRGSSHGPTRIFRSSYADPLTVRLAREARARDWPALEAEAGESLLAPWPCCLFGPRDGLVAAYASGVAKAGAAVEALQPAAARARFSALRLDEPDTLVLAETDAAVIHAERTLRALARQRGRATIPTRAHRRPKPRCKTSNASSNASSARARAPGSEPTRASTPRPRPSTSCSVRCRRPMGA